MNVVTTLNYADMYLRFETLFTDDERDSLHAMRDELGELMRGDGVTTNADSIVDVNRRALALYLASIDRFNQSTASRADSIERPNLYVPRDHVQSPALKSARDAGRTAMSLRLYFNYEADLAGGALHEYASELEPSLHVFATHGLGVLDRTGDDDGVVVVAPQALQQQTAAAAAVANTAVSGAPRGKLALDTYEAIGAETAKLFGAERAAAKRSGADSLWKKIYTIDAYLETTTDVRREVAQIPRDLYQFYDIEPRVYTETPEAFAKRATDAAAAAAPKINKTTFSEIARLFARALLVELPANNKKAFSSSIDAIRNKLNVIASSYDQIGRAPTSPRRQQPLGSSPLAKSAVPASRVRADEAGTNETINALLALDAFLEAAPDAVDPKHVDAVVDVFASTSNRVVEQQLRGWLTDPELMKAALNELSQGTDEVPNAERFIEEAFEQRTIPQIERLVVKEAEQRRRRAYAKAEREYQKFLAGGLSSLRNLDFLWTMVPRFMARQRYRLVQLILQTIPPGGWEPDSMLANSLVHIFANTLPDSLDLYVTLFSRFSSNARAQLVESRRAALLVRASPVAARAWFGSNFATADTYSQLWTVVQSNDEDLIAAAVQSLQLPLEQYAQRLLEASVEAKLDGAVRYLLMQPTVDPAVDDSRLLVRAAELDALKVVFFLLRDDRVSVAANDFAAFHAATRLGSYDVAELLYEHAFDREMAGLTDDERQALFDELTSLDDDDDDGNGEAIAVEPMQKRTRTRARHDSERGNDDDTAALVLWRIDEAMSEHRLDPANVDALIEWMRSRATFADERRDVERWRVDRNAWLSALATAAELVNDGTLFESSLIVALLGTLASAHRDVEDFAALVASAAARRYDTMLDAVDAVIESRRGVARVLVCAATEAPAQLSALVERGRFDPSADNDALALWIAANGSARTMSTLLSFDVADRRAERRLEWLTVAVANDRLDVARTLLDALGDDALASAAAAAIDFRPLLFMTAVNRFDTALLVLLDAPVVRHSLSIDELQRFREAAFNMLTDDGSRAVASRAVPTTAGALAPAVSGPKRELVPKTFAPAEFDVCSLVESDDGEAAAMACEHYALTADGIERVVMVAVTRGSTRIVRQLVEHRLSDAEARERVAALAVRLERLGAVEAMLDAGVDVTVVADALSDASSRAMRRAIERRQRRQVPAGDEGGALVAKQGAKFSRVTDQAVPFLAKRLGKKRAAELVATRKDASPYLPKTSVPRFVVFEPPLPAAFGGADFFVLGGLSLTKTPYEQHTKAATLVPVAEIAATRIEVTNFIAARDAELDAVDAELDRLEAVRGGVDAAARKRDIERVERQRASIIDKYERGIVYSVVQLRHVDNERFDVALLPSRASGKTPARGEFTADEITLAQQTYLFESRSNRQFIAKAGASRILAPPNMYRNWIAGVLRNDDVMLTVDQRTRLERESLAFDRRLERYRRNYRAYLAERTDANEMALRRDVEALDAIERNASDMLRLASSATKTGAGETVAEEVAQPLPLQYELRVAEIDRSVASALGADRRADEFDESNALRLPEYVLRALVAADVPTPYTFEALNALNGRWTHVTVGEFTAPDDRCIVPRRIRQALGADADAPLMIRHVRLPAVSSLTVAVLGPATRSRNDERIVAALEARLPSFTCVTVGDRIALDATTTVQVRSVEPAHTLGVLVVNPSAPSSQPIEVAIAIERDAKRLRSRTPANVREFTVADNQRLLSVDSLRLDANGMPERVAWFLDWFRTTPSNDEDAAARDGALDLVALNPSHDAVRRVIGAERCDVCLESLTGEPDEDADAIRLGSVTRAHPLAALARHRVRPSASDADARADFIELPEDGLLEVRHLGCWVGALVSTFATPALSDAGDLVSPAFTTRIPLLRLVESQQRRDEPGAGAVRDTIGFERMPPPWLWSALMSQRLQRSHEDDTLVPAAVPFFETLRSLRVRADDPAVRAWANRAAMSIAAASSRADYQSDSTKQLRSSLLTTMDQELAAEDDAAAAAAATGDNSRIRELYDAMDREPIEHVKALLENFAPGEFNSLRVEDRLLVDVLMDYFGESLEHNPDTESDVLDKMRFFEMEPSPEASTRLMSEWSGTYAFMFYAWLFNYTTYELRDLGRFFARAMRSSFRSMVTFYWTMRVRLSEMRDERGRTMLSVAVFETDYRIMTFMLDHAQWSQQDVIEAVIDADDEVNLENTSLYYLLAFSGAIRYLDQVLAEAVKATRSNELAAVLIEFGANTSEVESEAYDEPLMSTLTAANANSRDKALEAAMNRYIDISSSNITLDHNVQIRIRTLLLFGQYTINRIEYTGSLSIPKRFVDYVISDIRSIAVYGVYENELVALLRRMYATPSKEKATDQFWWWDGRSATTYFHWLIQFVDYTSQRMFNKFEGFIERYQTSQLETFLPVIAPYTPLWRIRSANDKTLMDVAIETTNTVAMELLLKHGWSWSLDLIIEILRRVEDGHDAAIERLMTLLSPQLTQQFLNRALIVAVERNLPKWARLFVSLGANSAVIDTFPREGAFVDILTDGMNNSIEKRRFSSVYSTGRPQTFPSSGATASLPTLPTRSIVVDVPFNPAGAQYSRLDSARLWALPGARSTREYEAPDSEGRWRLPLDASVSFNAYVETATQHGQLCRTRAGEALFLISELLTAQRLDSTDDNVRVEWQTTGDDPLAKGFVDVHRAELVMHMVDGRELVVGDPSTVVVFPTLDDATARESAVLHLDDRDPALAEHAAATHERLAAAVNRSLDVFFPQRVAPLGTSEPTSLRRMHCPYFNTSAGLLWGSTYSLRVPRVPPPADYFDKALEVALLRNDARATHLMAAVRAQTRSPQRTLASSRFVSKVFVEMLTVYANAMVYLDDFTNKGGATLLAQIDTSVSPDASKRSHTQRVRLVRASDASRGVRRPLVEISEDYKTARLGHGDDCEGVAKEIYVQFHDFRRVSFAHAQSGGDDETAARRELLVYLQELANDNVYTPALVLAAVTNKKLDLSVNELSDDDALAHTYTAFITTTTVLDRVVDATSGASKFAGLAERVRSSEYARAYRRQAWHEGLDAVLVAEGTARSNAFVLPTAAYYVDEPAARRAEAIRRTERRLAALGALLPAIPTNIISVEVPNRRVDERAAAAVAASKMDASDFYKANSAVYVSSFRDTGILDLAFAHAHDDASTTAAKPPLTHGTRFNDFAAPRWPASLRLVPYNALSAEQGALADSVLAQLEPIPTLRRSAAAVAAAEQAGAPDSLRRVESLFSSGAKLPTTATAILIDDPEAMPLPPASIVLTIRAEDYGHRVGEALYRAVESNRALFSSARVYTHYLSDAPVRGDESTLPPVVLYDVELRLS